VVEKNRTFLGPSHRKKHVLVALVTPAILAGTGCLLVLNCKNKNIIVPPSKAASQNKERK